jgi:hypothetical protein
MAAIAIAVTAASAFAAAQAQAAHAAPSAKFELKRGMYIGGFDAAVAKAHGYKIVTYANGDQQSVPVNPKSYLPKGPLLVKATGKLSPATSGYDAVDGDCGDAWIYGAEITTAHIEIQSGFDVTEPAIAYRWVVSLSDANGTSHQTESGTLAERSSWEHTWSDLYQYEYTIDQATTSSKAVLEDGSICYSGGPYIVLDGLG